MSDTTNETDSVMNEDSKPKLTFKSRAEKIAAFEKLIGLDKARAEAEAKGEPLVVKPAYDLVVGNPPYQQSIESDNSFAPALYHHFMEAAETLGQYVSLVYPSRWMSGGMGKGLNDFRDREIRSKHYMKFYDYSDSKSLFPDVEVPGGISYSLWNASKTEGGLVMFYDGNSSRCETIGSERDLVVRNPIHRTVANKIDAKRSILDISSRSRAYGKHLRNAAMIENMEVAEKGLTIYYSKLGSDLMRKVIPFGSTPKTVTDWKVFASKTAHGKNGSLNRIDRIFVGAPNEICSDSYIRIGSFDNKQEAVNCLRYLKTDLATFLLGTITPTQNANADRHSLTPLVDFATGEIADKPGTFLDFTEPETLDDQLAKIYELTEEDRELMRSSIKPWKDKVDINADK